MSSEHNIAITHEWLTYAKAFELKDYNKIAEFFHYPVILSGKSYSNKKTVMETYKERREKKVQPGYKYSLSDEIKFIKISIDNLFQSKNLQEEELIILQNIEAATNKLSQLNKSLLLLTKIENNQFKDVENINLNTLLFRLINDFHLIFESKKIIVKTSFKEEIELKLNPTLAELLFGNFINNAFKHNSNNGTIEITLQNNSFIITNTGKPLTFNENELFKRFKKDDASKDSLGLGLAIVKSIADNYNYQILYVNSSTQHTFEVRFSSDYHL
jgi:signal transduction histidine kinase